MPTRDRPGFVAQACRLFALQRYPNKELIVVAEGASLRDAVPESDEIRLVELGDSRSIGEKRNIACAFARGEIIVQWDDDDWYGPERIRLQAEPIINNAADLTGLTCDVLLELGSMQFWSCDADEHARVFGKVAGGTLAYRADVWRNLARYPRQSVAEDAAFLARALRRGARLEAISGHGQFIYVRHGGNTWKFAKNAAWRRLDRGPLGHGQRRFYRAASLREPDAPEARPANGRRHHEPLVSCITPTADRPEFLQLALRYFCRQDYPRRELIVIDDGTEPVDDLVRGLDGVRYIRIEPGLSLGAKRNLACDEAAGSIICHWDDDDWYAPGRLSRQVNRLWDQAAEICGLSDLMFLDLRCGRAWRYSYLMDQRPWLAGATLCYLKDCWRERPFDDRDSGEDNLFVSQFEPRAAAAHDNGDFFVGMIHAANTSPKNLSAPSWAEIEPASLIEAMGRDFAYYQKPPLSRAGRSFTSKTVGSGQSTVR
jgi:glycosyltransferase involved in cell wall biosynthesis